MPEQTHTARKAVSSSSLETRETSVDPDDLPATYAELRHSRAASRRAKALRLLSDSLPVSDHRIRRFLSCGRVAWLWRAPDADAYRLRCTKCRDALCPACQQDRARFIRSVVKDWLRAPVHDPDPRVRTRLDAMQLKHTVLTLHCEPDDLRARISRILAAFRRLRAHKWWRSKVAGGIWFLHVKWQSDKGWYHVHLHLLVDAEFLPQHELSDHWKTATTDSDVVWIKRIKSLSYVANYIARYVSRPADVLGWQTTPAVDAVLAMAGRRSFGTFGTWFRNLSFKAHDDSWAGWEPVAPVDLLLHRARDGDPTAVALLAAAGVFYDDRQLAGRPSRPRQDSNSRSPPGTQTDP